MSINDPYAYAGFLPPWELPLAMELPLWLDFLVQTPSKMESRETSDVQLR